MLLGGRVNLDPARYWGISSRGLSRCFLFFPGTWFAKSPCVSCLCCVRARFLLLILIPLSMLIVPNQHVSFHLESLANIAFKGIILLEVLSTP